MRLLLGLPGPEQAAWRSIPAGIPPAAGVNCPRCGNQLKQGWVRCPHCGTVLPQSSATPFFRSSKFIALVACVAGLIIITILVILFVLPPGAGKEGSDTEAIATLQSFSQALAEGDLAAVVAWLPAETAAAFTEALAELPASNRQNLSAALAQAQRISAEEDPVQQFAYSLILEGKKVNLLLTMERDETGVWRVTGF
ncbi:MAG: zinc ribbon domain-containing protein [bacterium]